MSRIVHLSVYAVVLPFRNLGTLRMPKAVGDHIWVGYLGPKSLSGQSSLVEQHPNRRVAV